MYRVTVRSVHTRQNIHNMQDSPGRVIGPSQSPLPVQHTTFTRDRHPCTQRYSNLPPQQASGRSLRIRRRGHWNLQRLYYNLQRLYYNPVMYINPLNPELNPICYLLALLGAHHFLHVSRIRVKSLTFRLLMSYIWSTHS